ncbi:hypothetical protein W97_03572 [Coniosporium apollinis CBS 100218]|uniref:Uncharacterized protein n=1 Tax=Coniosporium apollinis (strain CBS 100218) TaxID=1168221 RepID=R7YRQ1_CONA1|nr:uncharacterized protein W97_03572 [Coniosporium apollinis CBS 100218]EON64341.1 hypothetical protein W97_03572 [Coniosporium apollinis CBS 100218]
MLSFRASEIADSEGEPEPSSECSTHDEVLVKGTQEGSSTSANQGQAVTGGMGEDRVECTQWVLSPFGPKEPAVASGTDVAAGVIVRARELVQSTLIITEAAKPSESNTRSRTPHILTEYSKLLEEKGYRALVDAVTAAEPGEGNGHKTPIIGLMRRYFQDDQLAEEIDTALEDKMGRLRKVGGSSRSRRYLHGQNHTADKISTSKVDTLRQFCDNVEKRIKAVPPGEGDVPFVRPLARFGFTTQPAVRFQNHRDHVSSDTLMNLTESVCYRFFPKYEIEQSLVFAAWEPGQGWAAEILFTRLGGGYINAGTGFADCKAGQSIPKVIDLPDSSYREWQNAVVRDTFLLANLKEEARRAWAGAEEAVAKEREELRVEQQKLEDLRKEIALLDELEYNMAKEELARAVAVKEMLDRLDAVCDEIELQQASKI